MIRIFPSSRLGRLRLGALLLTFGLLIGTHRHECVFLLDRSPVLYRYLSYLPKEGDILFQSLPHGAEVDTIEGITHSPYSHCGVVLRDSKQHWVVIEALFNVHETPLILWMLRGREGRFTAYRLDGRYNSFLPKFKKELLGYQGRFYDFDYDMTDDRALYCSDLIYLSFLKASGEKMGSLQRLGDLDWKPYESFIRAQQGGKLPLSRWMITPAFLAEAHQLHQVYPPLKGLNR